MQKLPLKQALTEFNHLQAGAPKKSYPNTRKSLYTYYEHNKYTVRPVNEMFNFKHSVIKSKNSGKALAYIEVTQSPLKDYWNYKFSHRRREINYPDLLYRNPEYEAWEDVIIKNGTYVEMLSAAKCLGTDPVKLFTAAYNRALQLERKEDKIKEDFKKYFKTRSDEELEFVEMFYPTYKIYENKMNIIKEQIINSTFNKETAQEK